MSFALGLNAPWIDCGWDFGAPPPGWDLDGTHRARWRAQMRARVRETRSLGLSLLRWFVLGNGANLGPQPRWDAGTARWRWEPLPLSEAFFADLDALLDACASEGVTLLPSLTSFGMFERRDDVFTERAKSSSTHGVAGLRMAALQDSASLAAFDERILAPLVRALGARRSQLLAIELINEPEWTTRGALHGDRRTESVSLAEMLAFLRNASRNVRSVGVAATVGFVRHETNAHWEQLSRLTSGASLGLSLGQVHHYPSARERLPLHDAARGPCLVGEIATRLDVLPRWPDLAGEDALTARVEHVAASGYSGALFWSAQPRRGGIWPDRATQWDDAARAEVRSLAARFSR